MNESGGDASSSSSSSVAGPVVDNSGTVISKIANLYAERLMSDVVLVVGTAEFPSHRLILCASSDVFQIMLMVRDCGISVFRVSKWEISGKKCFPVYSVSRVSRWKSLPRNVFQYIQFPEFQSGTQSLIVW